MDSIVKSKGSDGSRECCSVKNAKMFLGLERNRLYIVVGEGFPGRHDLAGTKDRWAVENANRGVSD